MSYSQWIDENPEVMQWNTAQPMATTAPTYGAVGPAQSTVTSPAVGQAAAQVGPANTATSAAQPQAGVNTAPGNSSLTPQQYMTLANALTSDKPRDAPAQHAGASAYQSQIRNKVQPDAPVQPIAPKPTSYMATVGKVVGAIFSFGGSAASTQGSQKTSNAPNGYGP